MISILISVYNGERYLEATLQSVYAQTEKDWEIIIVDDGSTDSTHVLLGKAHNNYPEKIRVLKHPSNRGLTPSLIEAAAMAKGEFLARLDVGDFWDPSKLKKQIQFFKQNPDYILVGCWIINRDGNTGKQTTVQYPTQDKTIRSGVLRKNPFAHSAILMQKTPYKQIGGYNPQVEYGQDYELWFRMLGTGKAANLEEVLCTRIINPYSISYQKQKEQMRQCLKTQWSNMNKLNPIHYIYLLDPLIMFLLPEGLKNFIRRHHA